MAEPGAVKPLCSCTERFATVVVDATENGAVPVASVDVICPLKLPVAPATPALNVCSAVNVFAVSSAGKVCTCGLGD